ncbi:MAG: peptidylprolyl isomerase [Flavobacteriaceae bacterium]
MNRNRFFGIALTCFLGISSFAQMKKEVLFTIDDKPYYTDEFIRIYNKNLDLVKDESQKNLDTYLDLYVAYKMKVAKAHKLDLDQNKNYQTELQTYRKQLSKNYLTDTEVTDELIREAYNRSLKEIKASHILILVDENASEEDNQKALAKIKAIQQRLDQGEDFAALAQQLSEDPSAKENQGQLGYFSVFRMVYPFETAAYNTPKGEVSEPVRTRFGYHLIKVEDIRDNRGELTVAHIMLNKPKDAQKAKEAFAKIKDIHKKLEQGERFEELAKQFSEDAATAQKGGILSRFGSGQLASEKFEDKAFSLTQKDSYSQPFDTEFGFHIVKLIEKHPVKTFEESKQELEARIRKDQRSQKITESLNHKLHQKYKTTTDKKLFTQALALVDSAYYRQNFELPENTDAFNKVILTINKDKNVSGIEFLNFIKAEQNRMQRITALDKAKETLQENFINAQLNTYYDENLEREFPEFGHIMEEYKEGLLLFDLMEKEIWQKAQNDTVGLEAFYEKNKENYKWKQRINAVVGSSVNRDFVEQTKTFFEQGKDVDFIKKELNVDAKVNIMLNEGLFEAGSHALPKGYKPSVGVSQIFEQEGYYYVIKGTEFIPETTKTLDEARGRVISDYQQFLEENWVDILEKEFKVEVKPAVFKKVKKELNK